MVCMGGAGFPPSTLGPHFQENPTLEGAGLRLLSAQTGARPLHLPPYLDARGT